tara:strand:+ start:278 stop:613 length:336 start_codon:yes stop_codon:yes gene_type:complete
MDIDVYDNEESSENNLQHDFDLTHFQNNYEKMKKDYITRPYLTIYEKTKVISERAQQLSNGSNALLKNPEAYENVYEIALEELKQKKIPFIIKRPINNMFELWKLEDLKLI